MKKMLFHFFRILIFFFLHQKYPDDKFGPINPAYVRNPSRKIGSSFINRDTQVMRIKS